MRNSNIGRKRVNFYNWRKFEENLTFPLVVFSLMDLDILR